MNIALILLAAGDSRRFGSNKLLYEMDGRPMFLYTLEKLAETATKWNTKGRSFSASPDGGCFPEAPDGGRMKETKISGKPEKSRLSLTVVTQYGKIGETAKLMGASVLYNPRPWEGISSSLKIGLRVNPDADFALFAVADQPRLSRETLEKLLTAAHTSGRGMACASCGERWGNPCIFEKKYFPELRALTGDLGGKKILLAHPEDVTPCPVTGALELEDVDTPGQLQKLQGRISESEWKQICLL